MDIFNLKSNDVKDFKRFMDMKAPAFGGPNETESFDKSKRKSLKEWTNIVKRDPNFENGGKNHNNDGYWKAFHSDVPSRAAKVKIEEPLNTPPAMGVTIVKESHIPQFENYMFEEDATGTSYTVGQVLKAKRDKDGQLYTIKVMQVGPNNNFIVASITGPGKYEGKPLDGKGSWELTTNQEGQANKAMGNAEMGTFTFESYMFEEADENDVELDETPEIDEEALEMFMEEFSDELKEILEIACEKMEIEKEECVEIFKAAIQKVSEMPEEEESDEELEENFDTITESEDSEETYATYDFEKDGHMAIFAYPHHNGKDTKDSLRDWKNKDSDKRTVKFVDDYREAQAGVLRLKKASKE